VKSGEIGDWLRAESRWPTAFLVRVAEFHHFISTLRTSLPAQQLRPSKCGLPRVRRQIVARDTRSSGFPRMLEMGWREYVSDTSNSTGTSH
jgi:hypothetical protein